jgi:hypothetical protein
MVTNNPRAMAKKIVVIRSFVKIEKTMNAPSAMTTSNHHGKSAKRRLMPGAIFESIPASDVRTLIFCGFISMQLNDSNDSGKTKFVESVKTSDEFV